MADFFEDLLKNDTRCGALLAKYIQARDGITQSAEPASYFGLLREVYEGWVDFLVREIFQNHQKKLNFKARLDFLYDLNLFEGTPSPENRIAEVEYAYSLYSLLSDYGTHSISKIKDEKLIAGIIWGTFYNVMALMYQRLISYKRYYFTVNVGQTWNVDGNIFLRLADISIGNYSFIAKKEFVKKARFEVRKYLIQKLKAKSDALKRKR